ncbi:MAG: hypothetical protein KAH32_03485 [Chlamydiia bacterium]|nr:hypothetical protein [Chlamydiia bacterium]
MSKKKDIVRFPSSWEDREPLFTEENILFIPDFYDKHEEANIKCNSLFKAPNLHKELKIEYCAGAGDWLIDRSQQDLNVNWACIEIKIDRVIKILRKIRNNSLDDNVIIVCGDARKFAKHYIDDESVSEIYINFPDPWPKNRHAKHRLNSKEFISEIYRSLKEEGAIYITSDDMDFIKLAESNSKELGFYSSLSSIEKDFGDSFFRSLWEGKGRDCYTLSIKK